jgi:hypothetical protein
VIAVALTYGLLGGGAEEETVGGSAQTESRQTALGPVPLNKVDGFGDVTLELDGQIADVKVDAKGLVDGVHLMHIHADGQDRCPTAAAARLHNGHRAISGADGVPDYGRPLTSLTTRGDTSTKSFAATSRFESGESVRYSRKIDVGRSMAARIRRGGGVVVIHGIDWDRDGRYGAVLQGDKIPEDELSGELSAPALCGPLRPASQAASSATADAGKEVFAAAFVPGEPAGRASTLLCPLHKAPQPLS